MVVGKGIGEKQCFGTGIYAHIWVYIFAVIEYLNDIFLYVLVFCWLESKESWLQMSSLTAWLSGAYLYTIFVCVWKNVGFLYDWGPSCTGRELLHSSAMKGQGQLELESFSD